MKPQTVTHYCATVFDMRGTTELATVVGKSYAEVWRLAKEITLHPMLEWIEGGTSGKELGLTWSLPATGRFIARRLSRAQGYALH